MTDLLRYPVVPAGSAAWFVATGDVRRYQPEDRKGVESLYRRVFGHDAAEAARLRWDWQHERNPENASGGPLIWIAREGPTVVGQYGTMPVRLRVIGRELAAAWGTDLMVAPERQRKGLGELLLRTWDQHAGAALGLGLSRPARQLIEKLRWPFLGRVPCLVKPLTRRALRRPDWPTPVNRVVSAITLPLVRLVARPRPLRADVRPVRHFTDELDALWQSTADRFDLAVRRDAGYLNWKYALPPHIRYSMVVLSRGGRDAGYAVYRHAHEPRGRVTLLVDFLVDPADEAGLKALLRWIDREARAADSDKIRAYVVHAGFRRILRRNGYFQVASDLDLAVKVNAVDVPDGFYRHTDRWHVTLGDADQDR